MDIYIYMAILKNPPTEALGKLWEGARVCCPPVWAHKSCYTSTAVCKTDAQICFSP